MVCPYSKKPIQYAPYRQITVKAPWYRLSAVSMNQEMTQKLCPWCGRWVGLDVGGNLARHSGYGVMKGTVDVESGDTDRDPGDVVAGDDAKGATLVMNKNEEEIYNKRMQQIGAEVLDLLQKHGVTYAEGIAILETAKTVSILASMGQ